MLWGPTAVGDEAGHCARKGARSDPLDETAWDLDCCRRVGGGRRQRGVRAQMRWFAGMTEPKSRRLSALQSARCVVEIGEKAQLLEQALR